MSTTSLLTKLSAAAAVAFAVSATTPAQAEDCGCDAPSPQKGMPMQPQGSNVQNTNNNLNTNNNSARSTSNASSNAAAFSNSNSTSRSSATGGNASSTAQGGTGTATSSSQGSSGNTTNVGGTNVRETTYNGINVAPATGVNLPALVGLDVCTKAKAVSHGAVSLGAAVDGTSAGLGVNFGGESEAGPDMACLELQAKKSMALAGINQQTVAVQGEYNVATAAVQGNNCLLAATAMAKTLNESILAQFGGMTGYITLACPTSKPSVPSTPHKPAPKKEEACPAGQHLQCVPN